MQDCAARVPPCGHDESCEARRTRRILRSRPPAIWPRSCGPDRSGRSHAPFLITTTRDGRTAAGERCFRRADRRRTGPPPTLLAHAPWYCNPPRPLGTTPNDIDIVLIILGGARATTSCAHPQDKRVVSLHATEQALPSEAFAGGAAPTQLQPASADANNLCSHGLGAPTSCRFRNLQGPKT